MQQSREARAERQPLAGGEEPEDTGVLEVLNERFALLREIGQGSQGQAYVARDLSTDAQVLVKELRMKQVQAWKAVELFDREGAVLKGISHEAIPNFIDGFHLEGVGDGVRFFLVQEFIEGEDLQQLIDAGLTVDESGARAFLREMLSVLNFLHTRPTPVIHRDIKPANIMRRQDARLALIDFGAVQSTLADSSAKTVVGTSGFMPMEQLMGRAVPASDLYALAATTVHLLSRRHPAELPMVDLELQFRDYINVSDRFEKILAKMLAAHVEDRFQSAREVIDLLDAAPELADARAPTRAGAAGSQLARSVDFQRPNEGDTEFFEAWAASAAPETLIPQGIWGLSPNRAKGEEGVFQLPEWVEKPRRFRSQWEAREDGFRLVTPMEKWWKFVLVMMLLSAFSGFGVLVARGFVAAELTAFRLIASVIMGGGFWLFFPLILKSYTLRTVLELKDGHLSILTKDCFTARNRRSIDVAPATRVECRAVRNEGGQIRHRLVVAGPPGRQTDWQIGEHIPQAEQLYLCKEMNRYIKAHAPLKFVGEA